MASRCASMLAVLAVFATTISLIAQAGTGVARLVRAESGLALNGKPIAPDAPASTPGVTVSYVLKGGEEMVMNTRAGDIIPVLPIAAGGLDELDRWAREQAGAAR